MELTVDNVMYVTMDSLFSEHELVETPEPSNAVLVRGIVEGFGFHPKRLESHREDVRSMLRQLPREFMSKDVDPEGGDGWSFLNMCNRADGVQWTGLHKIMDGLICLGLGLGMVDFLMDRKYWSVFPGGVPYVRVKS